MFLPRSVFLVLLLSSLTLADFSESAQHRSFTHALVVINRSTLVDLSDEEMSAWAEVDAAISAMSSEASVETVNAAIQSSAQQFLGLERYQKYSAAVCQYFLLQNRADLAFDWHKIALTEKQREQLRDFKMSKQQRELLARDRMLLFAELLNTACTQDVASEMGKPYVFKYNTLEQQGSQDFDEVPNVEPLRVLLSPYVQTELKCTKEQTRQIARLGKEYQRRKWLVKADFGDESAEEFENLEEIRETTISDTEALLTDKQKSRFREIILQRYIRWEPSTGVKYALEYLGGRRSEKFDFGADDLGVEVEAIRRLRLLPWLIEHVSEVMPKAKIRKMVGSKPDYFRSLSYQPPKLTSKIAQTLLPAEQKSNPRRNSSSPSAGDVAPKRTRKSQKFR